MKEIQTFPPQLCHAFQESHSDANKKKKNKEENVGFRAFRADQSRKLVVSVALGEELKNWLRQSVHTWRNAV